MFRCPNCNSRAIGKVGNDQYYCWDCFVEYNIAGNDVRVFDIAEDGSLINLEADDIGGRVSVDATLT